MIPSELVMTRLPVPEADTATNKSAPYVTEFQTFNAAGERAVQFIPSGLVITR